MIELFVMRHERIERLEFEDVNRTLTWLGVLGKGTVWIRCVKPDAEDIEALAELTKISLDELKEAIEDIERSKVNVSKHLEIVYTAPTKENDEIVTVPIHIYAIGNFIATIEKKPTKVLNDLSSALVENKRRFLFKKPGGYFIFYMLDKINDEFLYYIDKISIKIDLFKEKSFSKEAIEKVYDTSIALSYFNQALIANIEVLNELRKSYFKLFEQEDRMHFSELYSDALQILDTEKIQRELLSNLFNMQSILTANKLSQFMKGVAFFALIITIPTLITNMYGMNLSNLPLAENPYAFYIILGFMTLVSLILYYIYKRTSEQ